MKNFKQLKIWQKGFDIAVIAYQFAATLPKDERLGLLPKSPEQPFRFLQTLPKEAAGAARKITHVSSKSRSALALNWRRNC